MDSPNDSQNPRAEEDGRHLFDEPSSAAPVAQPLLEAAQAGESQYPPPPSVPSPVPPPAPPAQPPSTNSDSSSDEPSDDEEEGMLRMSFLEHLEELRMRIIRALIGIGVAFAGAIVFNNWLWDRVREPAASALAQLKVARPLVFTSPTEAFQILWVKVPILAAIFVASPWVIYQVWAFIAPGLYKRERRMAAPFILSCAGLFVLGGLFAYYVGLRYALVFLLGIGLGQGVEPMITVTEYFNTFMNVILGIALVFELPVLIFFLTLLRVVSPRFLLANSRYAILIIVVIAAIITPTPDAVTLTIFSAPMILLYFTGVFASYLLVLNREGRKFPWRWVFVFLFVAVAAAAGWIWLATTRYGYHLSPSWPFLVR